LITTTNSERQRLTLLLGVTATGAIIPRLVVLKGKKVPRELEDLENNNLVITSSQNAWITEEGFLIWINRIWRPYSSQFKRTLLVLDKFKVHQMASVTAELKKCNTDIVYIPSGMTSYLQPCDIYVNKPLKDQIRHRWHSYMVEQHKENPGKSTLHFINSSLEIFYKPTKDLIIQWIEEAVERLEFADNAFLNVVLRGPEVLHNQTEQEEVDQEEESEEQDYYELVYEDDYEFDDISFNDNI